MPSPDQHLIDEFYRTLKDKDKNGHGENGRANPGSSKLTHQAILEKIFGEEARGEEFRDIYHGEYKKHHPDWSNSEAVASFLLKAAFYSGNDPLQMERLIRGSALSCPKFDDARGGSTWIADEIQKAIAKTPETYKQRNGSGPEFDSSAPRDEGPDESNNRILERFKTAKATAEETPAVPKWIIRGYAALESILEIDGKIKVAGKTTFLLAALAAATSGKQFLGHATKKTKAVLLTEQSSASFRQALGRAGLENSTDLMILKWSDVAAEPWPNVVEAAKAAAKEFGAEIIAVDTLGQFAGLKGDAENNAGAALEAIQPLQAAASEGFAVIVTRHERKGGGDVADAARGSSAWGGAVDVIVSLRRQDGGNTKRRVLESLSRYDETPEKLTIELTSGGYTALGEASEVAAEDAKRAIPEVLPAKLEHAIKTADVVDRVKKQCNLGRTIISGELNALAEAGVIKRLGKGVKGDPHLYYNPFPEDGEEAQDEAPEEKEFDSSGPKPYRADESNPVSFDLPPGETATVAELKARREAQQAEGGEWEGEL